MKNQLFTIQFEHGAPNSLFEEVTERGICAPTMKKALKKLYRMQNKKEGVLTITNIYSISSHNISISDYLKKKNELNNTLSESDVL